MKKSILILTLFTSLFYAQSEDQIGWIAKFGGAGGFTPMVLFPNYDAVNSEISKLGMNELSGPLYTWGGGGYVYVMIIDNLRLGGIGFSGYQSETSSQNSMDNEVVNSLGGGAATIEYTMPFVKNIALSAGLMIGGGALDIDIYQNSGSFSWDNIWQNVADQNSDQNKNYNLSNSFYFVSPTVNVDLPITRFLAVRARSRISVYIWKQLENCK